VLTRLGEKLSEQEVNELLKGVQVDKEGMVNYVDFVKMVMAG
jgi:Ca2+-binding EF-hand superfamily protein